MSYTPEEFKTAMNMTVKNGITFASRRSMSTSISSPPFHVSPSQNLSSHTSMVEEQRPGFKTVRRTYDLAITLHISFLALHEWRMMMFKATRLTPFIATEDRLLRNCNLHDLTTRTLSLPNFNDTEKWRVIILMYRIL